MNKNCGQLVISMDKRQFFKRFLQISDLKLLDEMSRCAEICNAKKGEILCQQGEVCSRIGFLINGVARGYLISSSGKEITDCFVHMSGQPLFAPSRLGMPSEIIIQSMTECTFISVPVSEFQSWLLRYDEISHVYIHLLSEANIRNWKQKVAICKFTALQRYIWFLDEYPDLASKISSKYIASYLNITPVTLSRLRGILRQSQGETNFLERSGNGEN